MRKLIAFVVTLTLRVFHSAITAQQPTVETERGLRRLSGAMRAGMSSTPGAYHHYLLAPIRWMDTTHFALFIVGVRSKRYLSRLP